MTFEEIFADVNTLCPDAVAGTDTQICEAIIKAEHILPLCKELKKHPVMKLDFLFCQAAADRKEGLQIVYFITSIETKIKVKLKVVFTDRENPTIDSVCEVWRAAEFYEREIFDLYGIKFNNHPDLRRIFLDDDWVGYPLRKDYKDDFMIVQ